MTWDTHKTCATGSREAIPDHPAGRWCTKCKEFLPLNNFRTGHRTYQCKLHAWPSLKEKRQRTFEDPIKFGLWRMWNTGYHDARKVYGHQKPMCMAGQAHIQELCAQQNITPSPELRIAPIDPSRPMLKDNIAIVGKAARAVLVNIWKNGADEQVYASVLLQSIQSKSVA
jgi:hypothetical protein